MNIGEYNTLKINRFVDFGLYLIDDEGNEVLMPKKYVAHDMKVDDDIRVFVYNDNEGRPVATNEHPVATVGDFALMRVNEVNAIGAFLDWGLGSKELLVPFREQRVRMQAGRSYIVYVYRDMNSGRIVASAKLNKFIDNSFPQYYHRQKVDILVVQQTELGYKVIVDNRYWGLVYQNETYQAMNVGERHVGFIKTVRRDGKIDVTLEKIQRIRVDDLSERIIAFMNENNGEMDLNDKSSPEDIMSHFSCSKKDFKKALGNLYKRQLIEIKPKPRLSNNFNK